MVKKAVVLAGGGTVGALFEVGALQALDALLPDAPLHTWDIAVGTSAGALVGTLLVHGYRSAGLPSLLGGRTPLLRGLNGGRPALDVNFWRRVVLRRFTHRRASDWQGLGPFDALWGAADLLPPGYIPPRRLARALHDVLVADGHADRFAPLAQELYVVATHLVDGERKVFGPATSSDVAISAAVAASCAVPLVNAPMVIGGHAYVDGGLHGPAAVDVAVAAGAELVVVINPLTALHGEQPEAQDWGGALVLHQATRTVMQTVVRQQVAALRAQHPDVRILLIEPVDVPPAAVPWGPMHLGDWEREIEIARRNTADGLLARYDRLAHWLGEAGLRTERHWLEALVETPVQTA